MRRGWIAAAALATLVTAGAIAALTVPDQVREIHRILTQERTENLFNGLE